MVMTYTQAKVQGQRSLSSKDSGNKRTDVRRRLQDLHHGHGQ